MKAIFRMASAAILALGLAGCSLPDSICLQEGDRFRTHARYSDFTFSARVKADSAAVARIAFGYEVGIQNGPIDGSLKTGSLLGVRNLYRSLAEDGGWFDLRIAVCGKNIGVSINGTPVVNYTQPGKPYRTPDNADMVLGRNRISLICQKGSVEFTDVVITHEATAGCPSDPVDETTDRIIRLQQEYFPVIDYHVHLKGGLTKEMAHSMSMAYGINYGVAPNAGEGGVGRMLADDAEVYGYFDEVKPLPFLCGVQGEGRKWTRTFSQEALGVFDYLFTDAMTIRDHMGRNSRIYRPEEVHYDGIDYETYMDHLVEQTVLILTNEPADIFANPTFLPDELNADYEKYWTDERVNRVLDVMEANGIAMEINPRYRIPSLRVIRMAKERGLKFTFGTNNVDADFGRLEYCMEAIDSCGIEASDIWFPSMSTRRSRPVILY